MSERAALRKYLPKKREAYNAIRRYMVDSDVKLLVEEEVILKRWEHCDLLLRKKEKNEDEIIADLCERFGISTYTARKDITNTQKLFADCRKINKRYLFHHHLQRIDEDIQRMRKKLFNVGEEKEKVPDAKELAAYSKLLETYTYTLNSIPEEVQQDKQPPPVFQFLLAPGQVIEKPMPIADALDAADAILMKQNSKGVYEMEEEEDENG